MVESLSLSYFPPTKHYFGELLLKCGALDVVPLYLAGKSEPAFLVLQYCDEQTPDLGHHLCSAGVFLAYGIGSQIAQAG